MATTTTALQRQHPTNLATRSLPRLSDAAERLVTDFQPGIGQRLATRPERGEMARQLAAIEEGLIPAQRWQIESAVGTLALGYPAMKVTAEEADARLALYAQELRDLPPDILTAACSKAVRECKFFPSVSEIRERAGDFARRQWRASRLKHLIAKHDREYREPEPVEPLSAEDQAELDRIMAKFRSDA
jgi:hypothetical protein